MVKITELRINDYKNISEADLRLSNFNVIVGPNNSGKSNFLQILSFVNHIINGAPDRVETNFITGFFEAPFGTIKNFTNQTNPPLSTFSFTIKFLDTLSKIAYEYTIKIKWDSSNYPEGYIFYENFTFKNIHKTGKASTIFERNENTVNLHESYKKLINVNGVSNTSSVFRVLKILPTKENNTHTIAINALDSILKTPIFYFSNTELRKENDDLRLNLFGGRTVGYNLLQEIAKLTPENSNLLLQVLKQTLSISDLNIKTFNLENNQTPFYFCSVTHSGVTVSLQNLSDGSLLIIALVVKILSSEQSIFLIEEPENSLHPQALLGLINFIRSFEDEKQFIITSHSIALINTIKPDDVIVARTFPEGRSQLKNISNAKQLKRQLRKGHLHFSDYLFFDANNEEENELTVLQKSRRFHRLT